MTCIALGMILSVSRALEEKDTTASPTAVDHNNPLSVLSETL